MVEAGELDGWLARAAGGDRLALQLLLVAHHDRLRALARSRMSPDLRARLEPEDLLQQVYVRVLQGGGFEDCGAGAFFGWLRSVLASALVDAERGLHAARRDVRREVSPPESPSVYDLLAGEIADSLTPSRVLARKETRALLLAALAGLSEDHRRVLELRFLEGKGPTEASALLGRSPEAVQMLTVRAVRKLRESVRSLSLSWG